MGGACADWWFICFGYALIGVGYWYCFVDLVWVFWVFLRWFVRFAMIRYLRSVRFWVVVGFSGCSLTYAGIWCVSLVCCFGCVGGAICSV